MYLIYKSLLCKEVSFFLANECLKRWKGGRSDAQFGPCLPAGPIAATRPRKCSTLDGVFAQQAVDRAHVPGSTARLNRAKFPAHLRVRRQVQTLPRRSTRNPAQRPLKYTLTMRLGGERRQMRRP